MPRTTHKNWEWSHYYLQQQFSAMRWLAEQGLSPVEIREARWGMVDETDRTITLKLGVFHIHYDRGVGAIITNMTEKSPIKVPIKGSGHEWFFLKSKYKCPYIFTAHQPKTWRKQGSREALFPLSVVEKCCLGVQQINNASILTKLDKFDNIGVSKLNITKMKTEEPIKEAEVIN